MNFQLLTIEIVYAEAHKQLVIPIKAPYGTTLLEALSLPDARKHLDSIINKNSLTYGVFGKVIKDPKTYQLRDFDRIEIYRTLIADPKEIRQQRLKRIQKKPTHLQAVK